MPSRSQTVADAIHLFENAIYPMGRTLESAWLGIYQTLLWYEQVNWAGFSSLPHIIDADKLRPSPASRRRTTSTAKPSAWQNRAQAVEQCLSQELAVPKSTVESKLDQLMRLSGYHGLQRQNPLGTAFAGLVVHVLNTFGSDGLQYVTEEAPAQAFPGIAFPGRSRASRSDILATVDSVPRAVVSAKWSIRHDRLNDITNECPVYKAAYNRIYRGQQSSEGLLYFVVTNEFDPARLTKALDDSCVDGVVHVHKSAVVDICGLDGRLDELMDLTDLVQMTHSW